LAAKDTEKSLLEKLKLSPVTCTRLKTKLKSYAYFHVFLNVKDIPLMTNTGVWSIGGLIALFFGDFIRNKYTLRKILFFL
jgi:hypothetical protein